jgi:TRAP-type C4-dicarboxylate transport system substrate-binding protein
MPVTEWAISLSTGVIDACVMHINTVRAFGSLDFIDTSIDFPGGATTGVMLFLLNPDKFNSLPADLQQLFLDEAEHIHRNQSNFNYVLSERNMEFFLDELDGTVIPLTTAQHQVWRDAAHGIIDDYLETVIGQGATQAREIYAIVQQKVAARS